MVPQNTCLVHAIWATAVHLRAKMIVNRVPSELSIADSPIRQDYRLIEELGGSFLRAVFRSQVLRSHRLGRFIFQKSFQDLFLPSETDSELIFYHQEIIPGPILSFRNRTRIDFYRPEIVPDRSRRTGWVTRSKKSKFAGNFKKKIL